ncbi:Uncharacterised protein [Mycobacteroides abscessus subsp. abscessus]|nr:Uncharacterised protein [Mycobacteroides abscessus subsp. abscessus]
MREVGYSFCNAVDTRRISDALLAVGFIGSSSADDSHVPGMTSVNTSGQSADCASGRPGDGGALVDGPSPPGILGGPGLSRVITKITINTIAMTARRARSSAIRPSRRPLRRPVAPRLAVT